MRNARMGSIAARRATRPDVGLYQSNFHFAGETPDLAGVRAEAKRRLGSIRDIECLETTEQTVTLRSMLGPFTHPVVCAILYELGGTPVDIVSGAIIDWAPEGWEHIRLRDMTWRVRLSLRFRYWRGMSSRSSIKQPHA
jgi:hypothetical protein